MNFYKRIAVGFLISREWDEQLTVGERQIIGCSHISYKTFTLQLGYSAR